MAALDKIGRVVVQAAAPRQAVAYSAIRDDKYDSRRDSKAYMEQRQPTSSFAYRKDFMVRRTLCDVLQKCPEDFFARPGIERLVSIVGHETVAGRRGRRGLIRPEIVLVHQRANFSATDAELAALLLHFQRTGIKVIEVASGEELTARNGWLDITLRATPGPVLRTIQPRMTALKARATKRRTGKQSGRPPYGTLPGESDVLKRIWRLRRKPPGGRQRPYREIAKTLNEEGCLSRSGRPWQARTIQGIVRRTRPGRDKSE